MDTITSVNFFYVALIDCRKCGDIAHELHKMFSTMLMSMADVSPLFDTVCTCIRCSFVSKCMYYSV